MMSWEQIKKTKTNKFKMKNSIKESYSQKRTKQKKFKKSEGKKLNKEKLYNYKKKYNKLPNNNTEHFLKTKLLMNYSNS